MKLLVFGCSGQVGRALMDRAGNLAIGISHATCDICDPAQVSRALDDVAGISFVVNCAGYTAVDRAESERDLAFAVNADGAQNVAREAAARALPVLYLSTDYVFSGNCTKAFHDTDTIGPLNVYGESKAAGERAVISWNSRHIILRVSWVFGVHGTNFVKTMLRVGVERSELEIVDDQIGGPTEARDIADAILSIATTCSRPGFDAWGIYQFTGAPSASWYDFACAIFAYSDAAKPMLRRVRSTEYRAPARRPRNSVLDCTRIQRVFGLDQPDWRQALQRVLAELKEARP